MIWNQLGIQLGFVRQTAEEPELPFPHRPSLTTAPHPPVICYNQLQEFLLPVAH
jgi:hypothetical protein